MKKNKETAAANEVKVQTTNEKASNAQLALIGKAVKDGKIARFDETTWKAMTKQQASEIITNGKLAENLPASEAQKEKIKTLVHAGFLKGMSSEKFKNLTSEFAKKIIYKGIMSEKSGTKVDGFQEREKLAPEAPATIKQKERLTQLVKDGFLNGFSFNVFKGMTHEQASKYIWIGKSRESKGEKAPARAAA